MNFDAHWLLAGFTMLSFPVIAGTGTAQMTGLMVRFQAGSGGDDFGRSYKLSLDTMPPPTQGPGLLRGKYQAAQPWTLTGFYRLEAARFASPITDDLVVNLPMDDQNGDGIPDIFSVTETVSDAITTGVFEDTKSAIGSIIAHWDKAAGSAHGQCRMNLTDSILDLQAVFTNEFDLSVLQGSLTFTTSARHTTGSVAIARADVPSEYGGGLFAFVHTNADGLYLMPGSLTFAGAELPYRGDSFFPRTQGHYSGIVTFTNRSPGTLDDRFRSWLWQVFAPADTDGNSVPDFSDSGPAYPGHLQLGIVNGEVVIQVDGESEVTYTLDQSDPGGPSGWGMGIPVFVGAVPAEVNLGPVSAARRFFRSRYP